MFGLQHGPGTNLDGLRRQPGGAPSVVVITRLPLLIVVAPGELRIIEHRDRGVFLAAFGAGHERCEINERLEDRARLALRLKNSVELRLLVAAAAHHRFDLAGLRSQYD